MAPPETEVKDTSRRTSIFGSVPASTLSLPRTSGPRHSMGMNFSSNLYPSAPLQGLPNLSSKASITRMSTFGSVPTLAGTGDVSSRGIWR